MHTIEIDFDVFKEITARRKTEAITPDDVLRDLFRLGPKQESLTPKAPSGKPWVVKGVVFPHGTEFRSTHKGQIINAKVEDGSLALNGKKFFSPSAAAMEITKNPVNGWIFWKCKLPGKEVWERINTLR